MSNQVGDKNFDHFCVAQIESCQGKLESFYWTHFCGPFSSPLRSWYRPPVLHTDLRFEDLRLGSLLKPHTHGERRISDVHGSMQIDIINSEPSKLCQNHCAERCSVWTNSDARCMKLGSSIHIEALVSMIKQRTQLYTGAPRRLPKCVFAIYKGVWMEYSANSYFIFTFGCVGCVKLFRVEFSFKTEHPTRFFYFFVWP